MVFSICPSRKSGTKNCIFLKRGSFGAAQVEKVESLVSAKAEKCVCGGAFARHIPVLSLYGTTPPGGVITFIQSFVQARRREGCCIYHYLMNRFNKNRVCDFHTSEAVFPKDLFFADYLQQLS